MVVFIIVGIMRPSASFLAAAFSSVPPIDTRRSVDVPTAVNAPCHSVRSSVSEVWEWPEKEMAFGCFESALNAFCPIHVP